MPSRIAWATVVFRMVANGIEICRGGSSGRLLHTSNSRPSKVPVAAVGFGGAWRRTARFRFIVGVVRVRMGEVKTGCL